MFRFDKFVVLNCQLTSSNFCLFTGALEASLQLASITVYATNTNPFETFHLELYNRPGGASGPMYPIPDVIISFTRVSLDSEGTDGALLSLYSLVG